MEPAGISPETMSPAELRAHLEDAGCTLSVRRGRVVLDDPRGVLWSDPKLARRFRELVAALVAHLQSFPCVGCGRDPFVIPMACGGCQRRRP